MYEHDGEAEAWAGSADVLDILRNVYTRSDCADFALALRRVAGWGVERLSHDEGYHLICRDPGDRLVDVTGFVDEAALVREHGSGCLSHVDPDAWEDTEISGPDGAWVLGEAVSAIRQLPWPPFDDPGFRALSHASVAGLEASGPENAEVVPTPTPIPLTRGTDDQWIPRCRPHPLRP